MLSKNVSPNTFAQWKEVLAIVRSVQPGREREASSEGSKIAKEFMAPNLKRNRNTVVIPPKFMSREADHALLLKYCLADELSC